MPPIQKRFPSQKIRKAKGHSRTYLLFGVLLLIIATGVGVYVWESSNPTNNGDFTISAPLGITIRTNSTTTAPITITATKQFTGTVELTATAPPGVNAAITPPNVTKSGTATLTMSATTAGNYTVTVIGTSGNLRHTVSPRVATPVYATLVTTNGTIKVELYPAQAPITVNNFVNLAQSHFYDNLVWHRIVKGFVIQTGDPNSRGGLNNSTWGQGGSSQTLPLEIDISLHNTVSYLAMAHATDPNSGSSQFYINLVDNSAGLDGKYTVFGKVTEGMDIALTIANTPVYPSSQPINLVFLETVTVQ